MWVKYKEIYGKSKDTAAVIQNIAKNLFKRFSLLEFFKCDYNRSCKKLFCGIFNKNRLLEYVNSLNV